MCESILQALIHCQITYLLEILAFYSGVLVLKVALVFQWLHVYNLNSEQVLMLPPTDQTAKRYLPSLISNAVGLISWQPHSANIISIGHVSYVIVNLSPCMDILTKRGVALCVMKLGSTGWRLQSPGLRRSHSTAPGLQRRPPGDGEIPTAPRRLCTCQGPLQPHTTL